MTIFFFGCCYDFSDKGSHGIMAAKSETIEIDVTYPVKNTSTVLIPSLYCSENDQALYKIIYFKAFCSPW